jgi:hypothetical protein
LSARTTTQVSFPHEYGSNGSEGKNEAICSTDYFVDQISSQQARGLGRFRYCDPQHRSRRTSDLPHGLVLVLSSPQRWALFWKKLTKWPSGLNCFQMRESLGDNKSLMKEADEIVAILVACRKKARQNCQQKRFLLLASKVKTRLVAPGLDL